jgi:two-component system NtrC family response regulator
LAALRNRTDDILPLAYHFLAEVSSQNDKQVKNFSQEAEEALKSYQWPGNARELQNIIGRAYFLCSAKIIHINDLPIPGISKAETLDKEMLNLKYKEAKEYITEKFEVEYLTHHLRKNKGNISRTADECEIDRRTIHRLIKTYNIIYKE